MKAPATAGEGVRCVLIQHDQWCPMAHGRPGACICNPVVRPVAEDLFASTVARDLRNRAQRRAAAKQQRRAK